MGVAFKLDPGLFILTTVQILTVCFGKRLQIKFLLHQLRIFNFKIIVFGLVRLPFKTFGEAETPQSDVN